MGHEDTGIQRSRRQTVKPSAVLVKRGDESFADTVQKVKRNVRADAIGESITKMRETRNGDLLIEVKGGAVMAEVIRDEVQRTCGTDNVIQLMGQRSIVELRDLDCTIVETDIQEALTREFGVNETKIINLRKTFGGEQAAIVLVPAGVATELVTRGRIRVGIVYCRARVAVRRLRYGRS